MNCTYKSVRNVLHYDKVTWNVVRKSLSTKRLDPEVVLSETNRTECCNKLKIIREASKFTRNSHPKTEPVKQAAVLVPLCLYKDELGFLYTLRSLKLTTNGGQVSFPGGIRDEDDKSFEETALRETWEELQIPKEKIDIWTQCFLLPSQRNLQVMPILGYIGQVEPDMLKVNKEEVEEAFVVTLKDLSIKLNCHFTQFRNRNIILPSYTGGKHRIWGLTAMITHIMMKALVSDVYDHKFSLLKPI